LLSNGRIAVQLASLKHQLSSTLGVSLVFQKLGIDMTIRNVDFVPAESDSPATVMRSAAIIV
jgi:hypothetical protein